MDDENEGVVKALTNAFNTLKQGVFWYLMLISIDVYTHPIFVVVQWVIMTLQFIGYAFYEGIDFPWAANIVGVLRSLSLNLIRFPSPHHGHDLQTFYLACSVFAVFYLLHIFAAISHRKLGWTWPVAVARVAIKLARTVLFVPVANSFAQMALGCARHSSRLDHPFVDGLLCWDSTHITLTLLSTIFLIVWFLSVAAADACFIDSNADPRDERASLDAKASGRASVLHNSAHLLLLVLFASLSAHPYRYYLCWALAALGLGLAAYHGHTLPHYHDRFQMAAIFQALVLFWTGVASFVATLIAGEAGTAIVFFMGFPVLLLAAMLAVRSRYSYVEGLRDCELDTPLLFSLRARLLSHALRKPSGLYIDPTEESDKATRRVGVDCEHLLQLGIERFPNDPTLHLTFTSFFVHIIQNNILAYSELQAVEACDPPLDVQFRVRYFRALLDRATLSKQSREVQSYLEFKSRKEIADECFRAAAKSLFEFWSELLRSSPDINVLASLGHISRSSMSKAAYNYDKLLEINPNSIPVLKSYGNFVLDLLGDVPRASELFRKADEVETFRKKNLNLNMQRGNFLQRMDQNLDIFDERNGVLGVIINRHKLGIIDSVNPAVRKLLGYAQASDMLGANVSVAIPRPIADVHDRILMRFLNRTTPSYILDTTRVAFALHAQGHIFPINVYIRWADHGAGKMVSVIQPIDLRHDVHFIVDRETGVVNYVTTSAYDIFGVTREQVAVKALKLWDVLPMLNDKDDVDLTDRCWEQIVMRTGLTCVGTHLTTGEHFSVQAWMLTVDVMDKQMTFVKIHVISTGSDSDDDDAYLVADVDTASESEDLFDTEVRPADDVDMGSGFDQPSELPHLSAYTSASLALRPAIRQASLSSALSRSSSGLSSPGMGSASFPDASPLSPMASVHDADADEPAAGGEDAASVTSTSTTTTAASKMSYAELLRKMKRQSRRKRKLRSQHKAAVSVTAAVDKFAAQFNPAVLKANTTSSRRSYRRLMHVIALENAHASRWLRRMSRFFLFVLVSVLAVAIAMYFIASEYLDFASAQMLRVFAGMERELDVTDSISHLRSTMLLNDYSILLFVRAFPVYSTAGLRQILVERIDWANQRFRRVTTLAAGDPSAALNAFNTLPDIDAMVKRAGVPGTDKMGLLELAETVVAMSYEATQLGAETLDINTDPTLYFAITNALKTLPPQLHRASVLMRESLSDSNDRLLWIYVALTVFIAALVIFVFVVLVRPIVVHIEQGKAGVLLMFLNIPRSVRRTLRRRAYLAMKDELEEDAEGAAKQHAGVPEEGGDEQDRASVASQSIAASTMTATTAVTAATAMPDAMQRYEMFSNAKIMQYVQENSHALSKQEALPGQTIMDQLRRGEAQAQEEEEEESSVSRSANSRSPLEKRKRTRASKAEKALLNEYLNQRSMHTIFAKYSFFFVFVMVYFVIIDYFTVVRLDDSLVACTTIHYALQRASILQRSFYFTREHLFYPYDLVAYTQPLNPNLIFGTYSTISRSLVEDLRQLQSDILFGNDEELSAAPYYPPQNYIMYDSICDLDPNYEAAPPFYDTQCSSFFHGASRQGIYYVFLPILDILDSLSQYEVQTTFGPLIGGTENPAFPVNSVGFLTTAAYFTFADQLVHDVLAYPLRMSSALYLDHAQEHLTEFTTLRLGLLFGFLVGLFALYLGIYHPIVRTLDHSARQTRAMMLVLPPDIVQVVASVQNFIDQHTKE